MNRLDLDLAIAAPSVGIVVQRRLIAVQNASLLLERVHKSYVNCKYH
jgi:hypothetical protein